MFIFYFLDSDGLFWCGKFNDICTDDAKLFTNRRHVHLPGALF